MNTQSGNPEKPGTQAPEGAPKRISGLLMISVFLSVGFIMMPLLLMIGPLIGGILAFVGWRKVKKNPRLIGPRFALVCMVLAVVSFGFQAYLMIRDLPVVMFSKSIQASVTSLHSALEAREFDRLHELGTEEFRESRDITKLAEQLSAVLPDDGSLPDPEDWFKHFAEPRVGALALSADGSRMVAASPYLWSPMVVWDRSANRIDSDFGQEALPISFAAVTKDAQRVLTGNFEGLALVWDAAAGHKIGGFSGHKGIVTAGAISNDGRIVLTATKTGEAVVWKTTADGPEHELAGHDGYIVSAAISGDGRKGLTGDRKGAVKIWDLTTGQELATHRIGDGATRPLGFLPGDSRYYVGSGSALQVRDAASGEKLLELIGHEKPVRAACVLGDGSRILTGSEDGEVRLWDATSGGLIRTIGDFDDSVTCLAVAENGKLVAAGSEGADVKLWDWPEADHAQNIELGDASTRREGDRHAGFARNRTGEESLSFVPRFHLEVGGVEIELMVRLVTERLGRIDFETRIAELHLHRLADLDIADPPKETPGEDGGTPGDGQDEPR